VLDSVRHGRLEMRRLFYLREAAPDYQTTAQDRRSTLAARD